MKIKCLLNARNKNKELNYQIKSAFSQTNLEGEELKWAQINHVYAY